MSGREKIEAVLTGIRPALHQDGGDVELVDYDEEDGIVRLKLTGACGACPISSVTLKRGIEKRILEAVPEVKAVYAQ